MLMGNKERDKDSGIDAFLGMSLNISEQLFYRTVFLLTEILDLLHFATSLGNSKELLICY